MCGIVGFVNYKKDVKNPISILNKMNNTLTKEGPMKKENIFLPLLI